jgi:hypothetical protein
VNARLETRVEKSAGKLKIVQERKKEWEKLNGAFAVSEAKGQVLGPQGKEGDEDMWEDVAEGEENGGVQGSTEAATPGEALQLPILPHQAPAEIPLPEAEEDEIL